MALSWLLTFWCALETMRTSAAEGRRYELAGSSEPGWPQFRGLSRDGRTGEKGLLQSWPADGPAKIWSAAKLGRGFSSPIVVNGRIYITGDVGDELRLFCLDAANGRQLWQVSSGRSWQEQYPGARATPTYSRGRVYLQNAHGEVRCFEAGSGRELWKAGLLEKFGGSNITWGMSECLLVDDRAVYATAGGRDALVVALDKNTGSVIWKSEPLLDSEGEKRVENASYVSPILVRHGERRLLIGCSLRHLYCVDADSGALQWTRRMPTSYSVLAMMPVLAGDGVFMTAPHGKPGVMVRLVAPNEAGGKYSFEEVWETRLDTCQGSVVLHEGKLIGSYYPGRKGWAALDAKNGQVLYQEEDWVKGAVLYADNRFYMLSENGLMRLVEAGADKFQLRGEFRLAEARNDAWAHPVILDGRMYLRYHEELFCYDIKAK